MPKGGIEGGREDAFPSLPSFSLHLLSLARSAKKEPFASQLVRASCPVLPHALRMRWGMAVGRVGTGGVKLATLLTFRLTVNLSPRRAATETTTAIRRKLVGEEKGRNDCQTDRHHSGGWLGR